MLSFRLPSIRVLLFGIILTTLLLIPPGVRAQMDRTEMLEQIAKLQVYISQLEKGYRVVQQGLTTIGDIKQGDFNIHQAFFNSLELVNPQVRSYVKIADILAMQSAMLTTYHRAYGQVKSSALFSTVDLEYIYTVYQGILGKNGNDIIELTNILTDGDWQMDDAQRIGRIDQLYASVTSQYQSLQGFTDRLQALALQKGRTLEDLQNLSQIFYP
jgi:hypothetical protein